MLSAYNAKILAERASAAERTAGTGPVGHHLVLRSRWNILQVSPAPKRIFAA